VAEYILSYKPDFSDLLQLPQRDDGFVKDVLLESFDTFVPADIPLNRGQILHHIFTDGLSPDLARDLNNFVFVHTAHPSTHSIASSHPVQWPARASEVSRLFVDLTNHISTSATCPTPELREIAVEKRINSSHWFLRHLPIMLRDWMIGCMSQNYRFLVMPVHVLQANDSLLDDIIVLWRTVLELRDNELLHPEMTWKNAVELAALQQMWDDEDIHSLDHDRNFELRSAQLLKALVAKTHLTTLSLNALLEYDTPLKFVAYLRPHSHTGPTNDVYSHTNVIIYDDVDRTLELFEPHSNYCSDHCACHQTRTLLQQEIVPIFSRILGHDIKLRHGGTIHEIQQVIEDVSLRRGACTYASAIYAHCRILNPTLSPERIGEILTMLLSIHWTAAQILRTYLHVTNCDSLSHVEHTTLSRLITKSFPGHRKEHEENACYLVNQVLP
jgi:hypothetical protein